ncbi:MAG TPA: transglycosylase family protein [Pseudonocardiaceae bacterium]|nr:transglycosylase family protein [Pseudonocardiaceae bacterium]
MRNGTATNIDWFGGGYPPGYETGSGYFPQPYADQPQHQQPRYNAGGSAYFPQPVYNAGGSGYFPQPHDTDQGYATETFAAQAFHGPAVGLRERPVEISAVTSSFQVTTEDVLDVLGPDADDLLATANLDVDGLISMINAETMLLPRIDEELEAMFAAESAEEPDYFGHGDPEQPQRQTETVGKRWKKRFLKATIISILMSVTGGAAMAVAMNKDVTVDVDGHDAHIRTYDETVGAVLADQGYKIGPHDALSPSPNAPVSDGGKIMLERGRQVHLTVDGVTQSMWTRSLTVGDALRAMNMDTSGAWVSTAPGTQIPLSGMAVQIRTPKKLVLMDGAGVPRTVTTTDATVGDLLRQEHVALGPNDTVSPSLNLPIKAGMHISISRNGTSIITVTQPITPTVQKIQDSTMNEGTSKVITKGVAGSEVVTYRVTKHNGKEVNRAQLSVQVTKKPVTEVIHEGTKALPGDAIWDEIAQCESGGDWSINTGNGYYGGLQFNSATWLSNGGGQYAPRADLATKAQQIAIADKVRAARGYEPWQCAGELGIH